MRTFEVVPQTDEQGLEDVRQAAAYLKGQACTLAARSISDGMLRLQFNREVAYFAQRIIKDTETGTTSAKTALQELKQNATEITKKSITLGIKAAGIAAGAAQIGAGYGVCRIPGKLLCSTFGTALAAHGLNNIYENTANIITSKDDSEGWVRQGYQHAAILAGGTKTDGNILYGRADIGLSLFGLVRLVPKPETWHLWYQARTDLQRGYKALSSGALIFEIFMNYVTYENIRKEQKKKELENE